MDKKVVYINHNHRSHNHNNGLYVVESLNVETKIMMLIKLGVDGKLATYEGTDEFQKSGIHMASPSVYETNLIYKV